MENHIARPLIDTFVPCLYFVRVLLKTNNKALHDLWPLPDSLSQAVEGFLPRSVFSCQVLFYTNNKIFLDLWPLPDSSLQGMEFFSPYKCFHLSSFVLNKK